MVQLFAYYNIANRQYGLRPHSDGVSTLFKSIYFTDGFNTRTHLYEDSIETVPDLRDYINHKHTILNLTSLLHLTHDYYHYSMNMSERDNYEYTSPCYKLSEFLWLRKYDNIKDTDVTAYLYGIHIDHYMPTDIYVSLSVRCKYYLTQNLTLHISSTLPTNTYTELYTHLLINNDLKPVTFGYECYITNTSCHDLNFYFLGDSSTEQDCDDNLNELYSYSDYIIQHNILFNIYVFVNGYKTISRLIANFHGSTPPFDVSMYMANCFKWLYTLLHIRAAYDPPYFFY